MASETEWANSVRATEMLLTDRLPEEALQAVYLPGLSEGMIASGMLFDFVVETCRRKIIPYIAFNGSDGRGMPPQDKPGAAWPGSEWYIKEFTQRGVQPSLLLPTSPGLHTRGEQDALVSLAKALGWKRILITTVSWHFVQVFSCLVAAMKTQDYWLAAYAQAAPTDWYVQMRGSQGLKDTKPFMESLEYSPKVHAYHERGFSEPFEVLFSYLENRELFAGIASH